MLAFYSFMSTRENQNTEFKESWREEYLKTVCAFANTSGGIICVGKDDRGRICGAANHEKLLEDIPNQIKNSFGIISDVKAIKAGGKIIVTVKVKASKSTRLTKLFKF